MIENFYGGLIMSVMTVNGKIEKQKIGIALPHEHVFIDLRSLVKSGESLSDRGLWEEKVNIANLDRLSRNPYAVRDNLILDDEGIAGLEVAKAKSSGYDTIVDVTNIGIARDAEVLRRISQNQGVNIIAGCGYYVNTTHPGFLETATIEEITENIINDLTVGIDETDIKAGIIGEIGTSEKVYPNEHKVLVASAIAQQQTGVAIMVHTYPWGRTGNDAIDILFQKKVDAKKIAIAHVDVNMSIEYMYSLLKRGVYIEFDNFGKEYYTDPGTANFAPTRFATDVERVAILKRLIAEGYSKQILLSCDICLKTLLHSYGGWGYDHIMTNILPILLCEGVSEDDIRQIIERNPQDFLDVV